MTVPVVSAPHFLLYDGQSEVIYVGEIAPDIRALVYYTRSAVFDENSLQVYSDVLTGTELTMKLTDTGYVQSPRILGDGGETDVWTAELGFSTYGNADHFYRMLSQQASSLTRALTATWDSYYCFVKTTTDALSNLV